MDELHEQLEQKALQGPNGGACIGIAWVDPFEVLCVRTFGDPANWIRDFRELTALKIKVAKRTGLSTRTFLEAHGMRPNPEERDLHPGALFFYERLIVASSGFCIDNEPTSTLVGGRLESFDIYEEPLRLVATG